MVVLALDTTTRQGSVAVTRDGAVIAVFAGDPAVTHAERLPNDLMRILDAHGLRVADVDLFGVASGPGSFTGLRIGIAAMQGLALANGKPLAGISALDATHEAVSGQLSALSSQLSAVSSHLADRNANPNPQPSAPSSDVAVWMDAQRGEVFAAIYRNGEISEPPLVGHPAEILARWGRERKSPTLFAGDGALAYRQLVHAAVPDATIVEPVPPLAPSVARLAERCVDRGLPASPDAIRPIYIRRADVEIARDKAALAKR